MSKKTIILAILLILLYSSAALAQSPLPTPTPPPHCAIGESGPDCAPYRPILFSPLPTPPSVGFPPAPVEKGPEAADPAPAPQSPAIPDPVIILLPETGSAPLIIILTLLSIGSATLICICLYADRRGRK